MAQINKPSDHFRIKLYTGNASNDTAITFDESTNMKPDWLWIKNRSAAQSHAVFDSTRGPLKRISPNSNSAEGTENTNLDSFDTNGFTVDNEAIVNGSGNGMVGWGWKANGGTTATNSNGSLSSTVQANTTAGFSIVYWTNNTGSVQTIGHGLNAVPKMIMMKVLGNTGSWNTYHESIGNTHGLYLNSSAVAEDNVAFFNDTSPTNQVFTTGTNGNLVNNTLIAYCFAEKKGYSRFGKYIGNGNANGAFVYTGFRPAWVMLKATGIAENWWMFDSKRSAFNVANDGLIASGNNTEYTDNNTLKIDILSNGFKIRNSDGSMNQTNGTYIFMAMAESPLVGTNKITAVAR